MRSARPAMAMTVADAPQKVARLTVTNVSCEE
jgi:hypothetical protein